MSSGLFKNVIYKMCLEILYMNEKDLALNNLQWLICYKTKPKQTETKPNQTKLCLMFLGRSGSLAFIRQPV